MRLAYAISDAAGRVLIGSGSELTAEYIEKLKQFGFAGLYINDELSEGIEIEPVISPKLRTKGMSCVREMDIDGCKQVASNIVKEILEKGTFSMDMTDLRSYDDYTFAHSVNVAIFSCVIGMGMKLREEELVYLVMAGLLHDMGKLSIPREILNKPARLTREEYEIMKSHAKFSYELIRERWDISAHIKTAVLHHHENVDGSGYPDGISSEAMTIYMKILHAADVYDALISKRPYKDGYAPHEACEYLMGGCGIMFDADVVSAFLQYVPLFPKGTSVKLSDGRVGIIYENSGEHNLRPIVRLEDYTMLDLMSMTNQNITVLSSMGQEGNAWIVHENQRTEMTKRIEKKHILAVDDMKANLQVLKAILENLYEVTLLKSGRQALLYLEKNPYPDIILMDIDMPEMNGIETTKCIQKMTQNQIPILFVSSVHNKETVLLCKSLHVAGYIVRPFNPVFIKSEIKRILEGRSEFE